MRRELKRVAERARADRLQARVGELEAKLEEAQRAGKRQAAPFSRNQPKEHPDRPGRRPGTRYGTKARRMPTG